MAPKRGVYRTTQFTEILSAVKAVLLVSESSDVSLPVPPLLELITEYADQPCVSTWFKDRRFTENLLTSFAILSIQPLTFLIVCNKCIYQYASTNNEITRFFGGTVYYENMFINPNSSNRVFVSTASKILVIENGVEFTLIGGNRCGYEEGVGLSAKVDRPRGMALTSNGESLIFSDTINNMIRSVNLHTRQTSAVAGDRTLMDIDGRGSAAAIKFPHQCVWNRLTTKPYTELFVTSSGGIRRLDVTTYELTTIIKTDKLILLGIDQTPSGLLLVTCVFSHCIYSVDPSNASFVRIAGSMLGESGDSNGDPLTESKFGGLYGGLVVVESECCLAVADQHSVRKVPLAPHFFIPPSSDT